MAVLVEQSVDPEKLFREIIGQPGESRNKAVETLAQYGVVVAPHSIADFRRKAHYYDGDRTKNKFALRVFEQKDDATAKIEHYANIGKVGLELRECLGHQVNHPKRYNSRHLKSRIAAEHDIPLVDLSKRLRAIRTDVCISEMKEPRGWMFPMFKEAADEYLNAFTGADPNPYVEKLDREWDRRTIGDFYRVFYEISRQGIGSWITSEVFFINGYYEQLKNEDRTLSVFDKEAVESFIGGRAVSYAKSLRRNLGVPMDDSTLSVHVHVLTSKFRQGS